ncbi:filamentous hemagglutinin N-terminal domain-containing protein [Desmonostoc muscorum CCALA 125]|nr:filamentous hemagglutinin N-terminal domain-containing protein [Desmonostoc muscorum CCALA 125]
MFSSTVIAQIIPDPTLPNNSQVTNQGSTSNISGGTRAGNNLFHSFEKFSLPTGGTAYFNNDLNIENIISRVTGSSISNIDGLLKANGTANLFVINPRGIIFGSNARLDIGGSFVGSTANSINFPDGSRFSATNPEIKSLLSINVPMGLQYGSNPGAIQVEGKGHNLTIPIPLFSPVLGAGTSINSLQVASGKTLALIGGEVSLRGGILTAPGGRIELGSVNDGVVILNPTGWTLGYQNVQDFQDIKLSQQALVDASGFGGSSIQLVANQISLEDGSLALIQNQGTQSSKSMVFNALNSIQLSGTSPNGEISSGFLNETLAGDLDDIIVSSKNLLIKNGATIYSKTFSNANGSNIILNVPDSIQVSGFSSINPGIASGIGNYTFSLGKARDIIINTGNFLGLDGATVLSGTFGSGKGGNLTINANQKVELSGFNPFIYLASTQLAVGAFNTGDAGILTVNAPEVVLRNGSNINSYTLASGNSGSVVINAEKSINITRESSNTLVYDQPFGISSTAAFTSKPIQELLGLSPFVNGNSGSVTINTKRLNLREGTLINVSNFGSGDAGNLNINAEYISLDNSIVAAATESGKGGNIFLNSNVLQLSNNSSINATARELGFPSDISSNSTRRNLNDAGNININTIIFIASKKNNITANAFEGRGGNIKINTQGLFISPDTKITASSQRGINGTVQVNFQNRNPSLTKVQPQAIAQAPEIVSVCQGRSRGIASTFVNAGAGGLAASSGNQLDSSSTWQRNSTPLGAIDNLEQSNLSTTEEPIEIVEAQGWIRNADGDVVLTAEADPPSPYAEVSASKCHELTSTQPVSSVTEAVRLK